MSDRLIPALKSSLGDAWSTVVSLCVVLGCIRIVQLLWFWPDGFHPATNDLANALFQGLRFDLKSAAILAIALAPRKLLPRQLDVILYVGIAFSVFLLAVVNLQFFGFYKAPINANIFGLIDDDAEAIIKTIWSDYPVLLLLCAASAFAALQVSLHTKLYKLITRQIQDFTSTFVAGIFVTSFVCIAFAAKGTWRAMPLGEQHISVTPHQFLNDMVPNGVIAARFAWSNWQQTRHLEDTQAGLRRMGFSDSKAAIDILTKYQIPHPKHLPTATQTSSQSKDMGKRKNLIFFLMESWGTEPMLYQSSDFNVLGRLEKNLTHACHFRNFDSAATGTFAALEFILLSSPISPLSVGKHGQVSMPWSIPNVFKRNGYKTIFLTSARSGWHQLDKIMRVQGFDEIVDAGTLSSKYAEAETGIWGVWDEYAFKWLTEWTANNQDGDPYFIFVLTSTNHPPYEIPAHVRPPTRNPSLWKGELGSNKLEANLDTYFYSSDLLGEFIDGFRRQPFGSKAVIAATGDHNGRTFGNYTAPERRHLINQVPFVVWSNNRTCGKNTSSPASHRDMFPTLLPLVGITETLSQGGRDLLQDPQSKHNKESLGSKARSLNTTGFVRNNEGSWQLGNPHSFVCRPPRNASDRCNLDAAEDAIERAQMGLLDWSIRQSLTKH